MYERPEVRLLGRVRVRTPLAARNLGLVSVDEMESQGTCLRVLGLGSFAFLPLGKEPPPGLCGSVCWFPSLESALAGLVLASRAACGRPDERLGGHSDV